MHKLEPCMRWIESWRKDKSNRLKMLYWRNRAFYAETILKICFRHKTKNRAEHIRGLEEKVRMQADQIRCMQDTLEHRNIERKALNILVGCDGPCNRPYMEDPSSVTPEVIRMVNWHYSRFTNWCNRGGFEAYQKYLDKYSGSRYQPKGD